MVRPGSASASELAGELPLADAAAGAAGAGEAGLTYDVTCVFDHGTFTYVDGVWTKVAAGRGPKRLKLIPWLVGFAALDTAAQPSPGMKKEKTS